MKVIDHLIQNLRHAAAYNPGALVPPACILWPDRERQWESAIPKLQAHLPELCSLGKYDISQRIGPAIWLRCVVTRQVNGLTLPQDVPPILYLPGVSRQELRAIESCPPVLSPIAELQYRGVFWSQINAKDWTLLAFLKSDQGGLRLDVAQDSETKAAMQLALLKLLEEDLTLLVGKRLDADFFNALLTGQDPARDFLQWIDNEEVFKSTRTEAEWNAFNSVCKSRFAFEPKKEGTLAAATKLANRQGHWLALWNRYCEAPGQYPRIRERLHQCTPPDFSLLSDVGSSGGWPQWNTQQEDVLRDALHGLSNLPEHKAREHIFELEAQHSDRRDLVWAGLGESPLACALGHIAALVQKTLAAPPNGTIDELKERHVKHGWQADHAVLLALEHVETQRDLNTVTNAIRSVYLPWAEESARKLQQLVEATSYPGGDHQSPSRIKPLSGDCVLFVDGLRYDTGMRLIQMLQSSGYDVTQEPVWSALPSVTATGKAAVTPVREKIVGIAGNTEFEPAVLASGQALGSYQLKKLLTDSGWKVLDRTDNGDGKGMAWCEYGDIDHEGHDRGWKLAKHVNSLLSEIKARITGLLDAGWKRVRVVTDHGWLMVPGGLPKSELPVAVVDSKWGRCAAIKSGATTSERLFPWYWNPEQHFVLADGVSCFRKGEEYAHGGLSLQECLTVELVVTGDVEVRAPTVRLQAIKWAGLRCRITVEGNFDDVSVDLRRNAGDAGTTILASVKPVSADGSASVLVGDDQLEGQAVFVVLIDSTGRLLEQKLAVVGGEE